jgi:cytochrome c biogenesis protein CcmG/thiol:disulfide interchange protein DsbE
LPAATASAAVSAEADGKGGMEMRRAILASLCLSLLAGFSAAAEVPLFSLKTLDGSTYRLSDELGKKIIILDFWATWCEPCKKFMKRLQEIQNKYPDVAVVAISVDDASAYAKVGQYIQGKGFNFTVLLDPDSQVAKVLNPELKIPFTAIIDRQGTIVFTHTGYAPGDEQEVIRKIETLTK